MNPVLKKRLTFGIVCVLCSLLLYLGLYIPFRNELVETRMCLTGTVERPTISKAFFIHACSPKPFSLAFLDVYSPLIQLDLKRSEEPLNPGSLLGRVFKNEIPKIMEKGYSKNSKIELTEYNDGFHGYVIENDAQQSLHLILKSPQ
jgi:hypothetical protein